jgi:hypothetical protein
MKTKLEMFTVSSGIIQRTMGTGSFPAVECSRGMTLTPHSLLVPRSKNRVGLYLYSPSGPSWPVKRAKPTYLHLASFSVLLRELLKYATFSNSFWSVTICSAGSLACLSLTSFSPHSLSLFNPFRSLMYQNVLDLNVACGT